MRRTSIALGLVLGLSTWAVIAQEPGGPPDRSDRPRQREGRLPDGPGAGGQRPPLLPIIAALDVNNDGVIDADEIAKASAALKKLDKNGDGKLTPDEFHGPRPGGPGGEGEGGPGGEGRRGGPGMQQGQGGQGQGREGRQGGEGRRGGQGGRGGPESQGGQGGGDRPQRPPLEQ